MPWLLYLAASVSPVGAASGDIIDYILGYGVLGIAAVLFVLRIIVPRSAVDDAKAQARVDLLEENRRLIARAEKAESQRDDAMRFATDQLVPLLSSFTATTSALLPILQGLIPILQEVARYRDDPRRDRDDRR